MVDITSIYSPPLPVFILLDTSRSMKGENNVLLNTSVVTILAALEDAAEENECSIKIRIAEFNKDAHWIFGCTQEGEDIINASSLWCGLSPSPNEANLAAAIHLVNECMHTKYLGAHSFCPLVILVSGSTSWSADPNEVIQTLRESLRSKYNPNSEKVVRISIGLPSSDTTELEAFASTGNVLDEESETYNNVPFVFFVDHEKASEQQLQKIVCGFVRSIISGIDHQIEIPDECEWEDSWKDEWEE